VTIVYVLAIALAFVLPGSAWLGWLLWLKSAELRDADENIAALDSELTDVREISAERVLKINSQARTITENERCINGLQESLLITAKASQGHRMRADQAERERDDAHRVLEFVLDHEDVGAHVDYLRDVRNLKIERAALSVQDGSSVPRISREAHVARLRSVE
jgi:hypothetical protein